MVAETQGQFDARQYAAAFVTQCTLSLNDWEGSWAGLCQCGSFCDVLLPECQNFDRSIPKNLHSEKSEPDVYYEPDFFECRFFKNSLQVACFWTDGGSEDPSGVRVADPVARGWSGSKA